MSLCHLDGPPSENAGENAPRQACAGSSVQAPAANPPDAPGRGTASIPRALSRKLTVVSFFSACAIVLLHAYENTRVGSGTLATDWATTLFSRVMTSFAVLMFFAVSGYLFGAKLNPGNRDGWYPALLKKRGRTLLVPYLVWCTIYAFTFIPFSMFGNHLAGRALVHNTCLKEPLLSVWNVFRIYGLDFSVCPSAGILWYVRNLLLLFLLTPLLLPVMKRRGTAIAYLYLSALAFLLHDWFPRSCWQFFQTGFSLRGLFCFPLGMYFAFYPVKPDSFRLFRRSTPFLWLLLSVAAAWSILHAGQDSRVLRIILLKLTELVGLCAVWTLPDMIPALLRVGDRSVAEDSFFLYVFHYDVLSILLCAKFTGLLETRLHVPYFCIFLLRFLVPLALSLLTAELLKRFLPGLYRFLTGGR